jgi:uncharacterized protein (DUF3820 family)
MYARAKRFVVPISQTVVPFGKYRGRKFIEAIDDDEFMKYLDWLSNADYLYDPFKTRLRLFLTRPVIARIVDRLFPDPDTEPYTFEPSYQRREPMPPATEPRDWTPPKRGRQWLDAWSLAADIALAIDNAEFAEDLPEWEPHHTQAMRRILPKATLAKIEQAYRRKQANIPLVALLPEQKRRDALLLHDAITEQPDLEPIARQHAPELVDALELLQLTGTL